MATSQLTEIAEPTGFESCTISMSYLLDDNVYNLSRVNGQNISVALMRPMYSGNVLFADYIIGSVPGNPLNLRLASRYLVRIPVYSISDYERSRKFVVIGCVVASIGYNSIQQVATHFFRRIATLDGEIVEYWYPEFFFDISMIAQSKSVEN